MSSNDIDLDAIEARVNAATPGPWIDTTPHDKHTEWADDYEDPMVVTLDSSPGNFCAIAQDIRQGATDGAADAAFIAAAREDVPALIAEIRRLREQLFAQKPVIDAAEAWAEEHEGAGTTAALRNADRGLHDAVEQYRLMDYALTAARAEQPSEVTQ